MTRCRHARPSTPPPAKPRPPAPSPTVPGKAKGFPLRSVVTAHMQPTRVELDLVPLQIADLGRTQSVAIGDQDHGGVAMPIPARFPGCGHQVFELLGRQVFPGAGN